MHGSRAPPAEALLTRRAAPRRAATAPTRRGAARTATAPAAGRCGSDSCGHAPNGGRGSRAPPPRRRSPRHRRAGRRSPPPRRERPEVRRRRRRSPPDRAHARRYPCDRQPRGSPNAETRGRTPLARRPRSSVARAAPPTRETPLRRTPALPSTACQADLTLVVRCSLCSGSLRVDWYTLLMSDEHAFLLQRVQPAMVGLIDGSLSTLAPIFAVALATHRPHYAFFAGLATAIGAGVSMAFSEGLSDTGEITGRGNPFVRGAITGGGTFVGGILHTLPFLIPHYRAAIVVAIVVVAFELVMLAFLRWRYFEDSFVKALASVTLGGIIIATVSAALGSAA